MTWKRCIALVLCALYLSATVGTALASLTCKCPGMKAPVAHLCTGHCHAGPDAANVAFTHPYVTGKWLRPYPAAQDKWCVKVLR